MIPAESIGRYSTVKHKSIYLAVATAIALLCLAGCGSYNLKSITLSTSSNELKGLGGTAQLSATGNYSNFTSKDITTRVKFTLTPEGTQDNGAALETPPNGVTLDATGMLTAVEPGMCTYATSGTGTAKVVTITGWYKIVASFNGVNSQPLFIGVASAASSTGGQCGP
jgi:hypothetical protein